MARPWAGASAISAIVLLIYVGLLGLTAFGMARIPAGFVPIQDKGYLIANIQLPDSASLERTAEATAKVERIALETPGVAHTLAIPGQSFVLNAFSPNFGSLFIPLKPFHERRGADVTARGHPSAPPRTPPARGPRGARAGLRGAGGARPGQRRWLQADGRGHRRRELRRAAGPGRRPGRPGESAAGPRRLVQRLPRPHAPALRGRGPGEGQDDGGGAERRLRRAAGLPGQLLRQRLQPLRPHLAGEHPGRRPLPQGRGGRPAAQGPQRRRRHGAAGGGGRGARQRRAGAGQPLQHVPGGADHRRLAARREHRGGPGDDGAPGGPVAVAQPDLRMDRAELPAEAVEPRSSSSGTCSRTRSAPSCWAPCWSSSSWPASTRAGRCRWR